MTQKERAIGAPSAALSKAMPNVPRGSGFGRRLRQRRAVTRQLDRSTELLYGIPSKYPEAAA